MFTTTSAFRLALTAAAICAAAPTAIAKPKRVVVLDFDGPRQLADASRSSVMSILGEQYDVISTKSWDKARTDAARYAHGPEQWMKAAKTSGVGAVIEGIVQEEGRRKILNITVRQADNGKEFDTIQVRIDRSGPTTAQSREIQSSLEQVLYWIDTGRNETAPTYSPVAKTKLGATKTTDETEETVRPRRRASDDEVESRSDRDARRGRRVAEADEASDDARTDARTESRSRKSSRNDRDERADERADKDADTDHLDDAAHDAKPATVAAATDPEVHDISVLFPQSQEDRERLNPKINHVPQKTPRFAIDAGGYMASRNLNWTARPDAEITDFSGIATKGFAVNVAAYPFPLKAMDGGLSGFGITASMSHSAGSTVEFDSGDAVEEYVLNQNSWELGVHYRAPLTNMITVDGGAMYGNQTYEILDASQDFEVPDTKYSYLGATAHLDLAITEKSSVGFGARYFTVLDTGMLSSTDWYGPTSASGLGLDATFQIPLPASLYVRGVLSYQRISLTTSGGGVITDDEEVTGGKDSLITGNVNLGISF